MIRDPLEDMVKYLGKVRFITQYPVLGLPGIEKPSAALSERGIYHNGLAQLFVVLNGTPTARIPLDLARKLKDYRVEVSDIPHAFTVSVEASGSKYDAFDPAFHSMLSSMLGVPADIKIIPTDKQDQSVVIADTNSNANIGADFSMNAYSGESASGRKLRVGSVLFEVESDERAFGKSNIYRVKTVFPGVIFSGENIHLV